MIKIGYQGIPGSNAEEIAKQFVLKNKIKEYKLIPLISSYFVVKELKNKEIDFGIMAIYNTLGGEVQETKKALELENFEEYDTITIQIHHCLFKRKDFNKELKTIVSHEQALKQTKNNRLKLYPNCREQKYLDTALAAKDLSEGKLSENNGVLCRKNAGEMYNNLELLFENLEDDKNNFTTFKIYKN